MLRHSAGAEYRGAGLAFRDEIQIMSQPRSGVLRMGENFKEWKAV